MDEASADLVLSLQLEDLDRLLGASAEQQATLKQPDSRVALTTYHDELDKRRRNIRDGRMGRSIAQAVRNDAPALLEARSQENQAKRDRIIASTLRNAARLLYPPCIRLMSSILPTMLMRYSCKDLLLSMWEDRD